jgi:HSP20 family protein
MAERTSWYIGLHAGEGFTAILKGLTNIVDKLRTVAEEETRNLPIGEDPAAGAMVALRGIYGFFLKTGPGGVGITVEPFGNIRRDETTGEPVVQELREPITDVLNSGERVLIVAELPGIGLDDVRIEVGNDLLTLCAERSDRKYRKQIPLTGDYPREKMRLTCQHGVLEIECTK